MSFAYYVDIFEFTLRSLIEKKIYITITFKSGRIKLKISSRDIEIPKSLRRN